MPNISASKTAGFTLVEMLVAVALFALLGGIVFQFFVSGFVLQRNTLSIQESTNQVSFMAEYMGRALRQAKKELADPAACLTGVGRGWNYEVSPTNDSITFLDRNGICRHFLLSGNQIMEQISTDHQAANFGAAQSLTPLAMTVTNFRVVQQGADQQVALQPRVTFVIEAEGKGAAAKVRVQTTISQRTFDVVY
ncbi:MAG: hypothetical protein A3E08_00820 [Candidatus Wildermuthbacteria bacterium RIFCSPHIGHO2_12_FULL_49_13]|nr:MAG: hypothetical protein UY45_C0008G0009 [Parcubacteria group bacterium GW2011_GWA1_49_26]OHA72618.1 MAG: hypothetical protein A3E08_00820 [Candidatus Wildermuthbacteria bacterium RIFCSPHIGHO2_12_FULL_49_13]